MLLIISMLFPQLPLVSDTFHFRIFLFAFLAAWTPLFSAVYGFFTPYLHDDVLASEIRVPQNRTSELLEGQTHKLREVLYSWFLLVTTKSYSESW